MAAVLRCRGEQLAAGVTARRVTFGEPDEFRTVDRIHRQYSYGRLELRVTFTDGTFTFSLPDTPWEVAQ